MSSKKSNNRSIHGYIYHVYIKKHHYLQKIKASPIFTNRKGVYVTTKAKNGNKKIRKDVDKEESGFKF